MTDDADFSDFLRRLRCGDEAAAMELVRRYERVIRREVRLRLGDPSLTRLIDSEDICQSVLASFFVRVASGQYDLDRPAQLLGLLLSMARHKLAFASRRNRAQRRDGRRNAPTPVDEVNPAGDEPTPSRVVAGQELLEEVRRRLSDEERHLAEQRAQGKAWADIARELGGTADGRRMQLTRALDRVVVELGLPSPSDT